MLAETVAACPIAVCAFKRFRDVHRFVWVWGVRLRGGLLLCSTRGGISFNFDALDISTIRPHQAAAQQGITLNKQLRSHARTHLCFCSCACSCSVGTGTPVASWNTWHPAPASRHPLLGRGTPFAWGRLNGNCVAISFGASCWKMPPQGCWYSCC